MSNGARRYTRLGLFAQATSLVTGEKRGKDAEQGGGEAREAAGAPSAQGGQGGHQDEEEGGAGGRAGGDGEGVQRDALPVPRLPGQDPDHT